MRPDDVDDLTQEVFVRFLSVEARGHVRDPLGYLTAIAKHVFADFLGDCNKLQLISRGELFGLGGLTEQATTCTNDLAESLSMQEEIDRLLRCLPRSQRIVLFAHEHDGYTYQEVAAKFGFTEQTVEKYLVLAKASIRARCRSKVSVMPRPSGARVQEE
jgi:RNA polymerase sigma factor (sigma-70 family)